MLYNNYCIHEINEYLMTLTTYIYIKGQRGPIPIAMKTATSFFPFKKRKMCRTKLLWRLFPNMNISNIFTCSFISTIP